MSEAADFDRDYRRLLAAMREESPRHAETLERWLEQGRREVLREIAASGPYRDGLTCHYCGVDCAEHADVPHKADCLYVRAQEAVKP
ncbi:MAG TPA: hypothetical protein VHL34_24780 [Rhizomicrobium sp.]|jgi:hypothetical protein|nr:hypothetical protein [Rhizomicrobium sp.]